MAEMAFVLPVFLAILFAVIEFGQAFNYWIDETHLANEAARWVAVASATPANSGASGCSSTSTIDSTCLTNYLRSQSDSGQLQDSSSGLRAVVCFSGTAAAAGGSCSGTQDCSIGNPVSVTVWYTKSWPLLTSLGGLFPSLNIGSRTITARATMRIEAKPTNYSAGTAPGTACA
jgi:Flp pilus assembly protein TadG